MRRASLVSAFVALLVGGGLAIAQTPAPAAAKAQTSMPAGHEHGDGMCAGMMGGGMMGGGMGPMMMGGAGTKVSVKNVDKGVTITLTSADPATATRLQKMAEGMRLMHEAMTPEK